MKKWQRVTIPLVVLTPFTVIICWASCNFLRDFGIIHKTSISAVYDGMTIHYYQEKKLYSQLKARSSTEGWPPELYIRIGGDKAFSIRDLKEDYFNDKEWYKSTSFEEGTFSYSRENLEFRFIKGQLDSFQIDPPHNGTSEVAIGRTPHGKFGSLPMTKQEMLEVLGEPLYHRKTKYYNQSHL